MDSPGGYSLPQGLRAVVCESEGIITFHLSQLLKKQHMSIVGMVQSYDSLVAVSMIERPDLIVTALDLDGEGDALDAIRVILDRSPACVVVLSSETDERTAAAAQDAGACGILFKPVDGLSVCTEIGRAYEKYQNRIPQCALREQGYAS